MLCPVATPKDITENLQLISRGYWVKVRHPELDQEITYPGAFAKATRSSCEIRHRSPLIGEHNEDIYVKELGFSKEEIGDLIENKIIVVAD